jgi:hypothetical protein
MLRLKLPHTTSLLLPPETGRRTASSLPSLVPEREVVGGRDDVEGRDDLTPENDFPSNETPKTFLATRSSNAAQLKLQAASCPLADSSGEAAALRAYSARVYRPARERHRAQQCKITDTAMAM